jgi:hypothetical protein
LYKLLAEAPDPVVGLSAALDDSHKSNVITELEIENKKYKTELEEFRKEFQEIQNQEVTIRRLEDKITDYESKVQLRVLCVRVPCMCGACACIRVQAWSRLRVVCCVDGTND